MLDARRGSRVPHRYRYLYRRPLAAGAEKSRVSARASRSELRSAHCRLEHPDPRQSIEACAGLELRSAHRFGHRHQMPGRLGAPLGTLLLLLQSAGAWHEEFRLSAYVNIEHGPWFPEYKTGNVDWARVAQRATDLILYSVEPSSDGGVVHVPHVPPEVLEAARLAREHHPGVRLHVCVGGPGKSAAFGPVVINLSVRRSLIKELVRLAVDEDLDGIDFAWDGDVNPSLDSGYAQLMTELKEAAAKAEDFTKKELVVTMMVQPGEEHPQAYGAADYIHLMSYDNCTKVPCQHSTYENAQANVQEMLALGAEPSKLVLGIPAYAREKNDPEEVRSYNEILRDGGPVPLDQDEVSPEKHRTMREHMEQHVGKTWYFNSVGTVVKKAEYAVQQGLAGVYVWEAGQDASIRSYSLMAALGDVKKRKKYDRDRQAEMDEEKKRKNEAARLKAKKKKEQARKRARPRGDL